MSSLLITWIADATSVNFSGNFETEVISIFISSSTDSFLISEGVKIGVGFCEKDFKGVIHKQVIKTCHINFNIECLQLAP
jgi:hypothetical protein